MAHPRTLRVGLGSQGYYMEIDTSKEDCLREMAHWHLCRYGSRVGQISPAGDWKEVPTVSEDVLRQAEKLTSIYQDVIYETYVFNKSAGT